MKILKLTAAIAAAVLLSGCSEFLRPDDTSAGMNGLQQRAMTSRNLGEDLEATYDDVWCGVLATLQLNGFILKQADKKTGYIYGVWKDTYEAQYESSLGSFVMSTLQSNPSWAVGMFNSRTTKFEQIEVSVTFEKLARTQTLVRLSARFDSEGYVMAEGMFANRFFGLVRKEIFLRKAQGSLYQTYAGK